MKQKREGFKQWGPDSVDFCKVGEEITSNDDGFYYEKGTLMGIRSHAQQLLTVNKTADRDRTSDKPFIVFKKTESASLYEHENKKSMEEAAASNGRLKFDDFF